VDCRDRKGGEHGARTSIAVYGAHDQGSKSITIVKGQNSQVLGTGSRNKGDSFSLDGPTQILIFQHMRGNLFQMVRV
jgi:hypothetical protein